MKILSKHDVSILVPVDGTDGYLLQAAPVVSDFPDQVAAKAIAAGLAVAPFDPGSLVPDGAAVIHQGEVVIPATEPAPATPAPVEEPTPTHEAPVVTPEPAPEAKG